MTVVEWSKIHLDSRNASIKIFKKLLFKEIRPGSHPVSSICKLIGLKLLTRLRLGLGHINEHKFNHNFENCVNTLCTCSFGGRNNFSFFYALPLLSFYQTYIV